MNNNLLVTFIVLNIINVILQTVKSLCTVKCGKAAAATVNAIAYGLYTVVIIYTVCDLPLITKAIVVALCNLVGVYIVKLLEEKTKKDKLWEIKTTFKYRHTNEVIDFLNSANIPYNYFIDETEKYTVFNIYCATQKESASVKEIITRFNAKYFVSESKTL